MNVFKLCATWNTEKYINDLRKKGFNIVNYDHDYYIGINSLEDLGKLQQIVAKISNKSGLSDGGLVIDFKCKWSKTGKYLEIYNDWRE